MTQATGRLRAALQRLELAGAYHRAARARRLAIPHVELTALEHLDALGGLTPGELGHRLGLTSGGVTALTGRLVDAGLVARRRHPEDGRMRVLTVTPAGADLLREHLGPVLAAGEEQLGALAGAETERLVAALDAVATRTEEEAAATLGPSASTRATASRARS
jgi:DNA-binding MarR family transcriptional regulator